MIGDLTERIGIGITVLFVIVILFLNPSITGVGFALVVIIGACSIWLVRALYFNESDRRDE